MKINNITTIVGTSILGISIILSSFIISSYNFSSKNPDYEAINTSINIVKPLMTINETSEYMNISESQVRKIISTEESILNTSGTYSGMMFPITMIDNEIYVSSAELNEWIKESVQQRKQY